MAKEFRNKKFTVTIITVLQLVDKSVCFAIRERLVLYKGFLMEF